MAPSLRGNHPWKDFTSPWKEASTRSHMPGTWHVHDKKLIGWQAHERFIKLKQPANKPIKTPRLRNYGGNLLSSPPFPGALCPSLNNLCFAAHHSPSPSGLPLHSSKGCDQEPGHQRERNPLTQSVFSNFQVAKYPWTCYPCTQMVLNYAPNILFNYLKLD